MARVLEQRLGRLLEPVITMLGYELVGLEYMSQGPRALLRIYIDADQGITVDDCERVSRQVSAVLDVEDPIQGQYTLEVSSPGLDRPLFKPEHFERFCGSVAKLRLRRPHDGRRNFKGTLLGVKDQQVVMEVEGEEVLLPFTDIDKARLVPQL